MLTTPSSPIRVVIADDHAIVRDGLRTILDEQPDITVVGERENSAEIVEVVSALNCDVLLMDLTMPGGSGLAGLNALQKAGSEVRTLILTVHTDATYLQQALGAGAAGYLTKRSSASALLAAVRATAAGQSCIEPGTNALSPEQDALRRLSKREREVLRLVALGYTNQEAAVELDISTKSVEGYRRRMVLKIGAANRADIVRFALKNKLLSEAL